MTLVQLQCFLHTAEEMSFTKAAKRLFISRQVVSTHVKTLEEELGFPLFLRYNRSIRLTESGRVLYTQLCSMQAQFNNALEDARSRSGSTELSFGVCELADDWDWRLYEFMEKHPGCRLNVVTLPLNMLEEGLISGRFDMIATVYSEFSSNFSARYCIERMRPLHLVIAVSRKHPLAKRHELTMADLDGISLYTVSTEYSAKASGYILGHFARCGVHPREVKEFANYKSLEIALADGEGVCIVFDAFLANRGNRLKLFPMGQLPGVHAIPLAIAYRRNGPPILSELSSYLLESGM